MTKKNYHNTLFGEGMFHVLFWLLVIHFLFDIGGLSHSFQDIFIYRDSKMFDEAFLLLPISAGLFYLNLLYLMPRFLNLGNWFWYCILLLLSYILVCSATVYLYKFIAHSGFTFAISAQEISDFSIQLYLQILIASTALGAGKIAFKNLSLKREAEENQKKAELKYLANQFNPHFLHNMLNSIYAKAIEENAPQTTEIIASLSEIMRYPINQGLRTQVPLAEEVKFIEDYIRLQKLRLGEDYPIYFEKEAHLDPMNILPLSLIVLVENSFKYGVSIKDQSPISFQLKQVGNHIQFTTTNYFKNKENISSHNIGIENLKKRLQLIYQDKFSIKTTVRENQYFVDLKLEARSSNKSA